MPLAVHTLTFTWEVKWLGQAKGNVGLESPHEISKWTRKKVDEDRLILIVLEILTKFIFLQLGANTL